MPLIDSGAALFAGSSQEFIELAPASRLTAHLTDAFRSRWGRVSDSEIRAWRNSLTAMAEVAKAASLDTAGVGVELKLPLTDRRIDALFAGSSSKGEPGVVLVELKQWSSAAPSQFPDNVLVGGVEHLHPSVQAASYAEYLRGAHSAFSQSGLELWPCAYLHNMAPDTAPALRGVRYEGAIADAPFYVKGEESNLAQRLADHVGHGDGMALLPSVVRGEYRPSKKLLESIQRSLQDSPVWTLLDEQRLSFNIVRGLVEQSVKGGSKAVVIVTGGPGTGKSVIAAHLLIALAQADRRRVAHATGSKAFTTNLRALSRGAGSVFRYFNNFMPHSTDPDELDALICDEAHRIRRSSNGQYTRRDQRSELSQAEELIRAARVSVFFLDQRQNVRPDEIGSVEAIEEAAARQNVPVRKHSLDAQFRCNGCAAYVDWVDKLMSPQPEVVGGWLLAGDYDLRVFDSPSKLETAIQQKARGGDTARIVAGFCWPWSDPRPDGALEEDVVIGDWRRPWNEKAPDQFKGKKGTPPRPERHPYTLWATQPDRVREVGCIYSAQGFEFDYSGVIIGNDLVWREGHGWLASKDASKDNAILRSRLTGSDLTALIQHTYRVLLTRGMKGTFVYSTDWETLEMLKRLLVTDNRR